MTLREELARRLIQTYIPGPPIEEWGQWDNVKDGWLNLADECIRQMEWAAVMGTESFLTLAPADWKPCI